MKLMFAMMLAVSVEATFASDIPLSIATSGDSELVVKTGKGFIGGTMVICNSANKVIATHTLKKRKLVIDFENAGFGEYTIKLVKGDKRQYVRYFKR